MKQKVLILLGLIFLVIGQSALAVTIPVKLMKGNDVVKEWQATSGTAYTSEFTIETGNYTLSLPNGFKLDSYDVSFKSTEGSWNRTYTKRTWNHMAINGTSTTGGTINTAFGVITENPTGNITNQNGTSITVSNSKGNITSITIRYSVDTSAASLTSEVDLTYYIVNPGFESSTWDAGWTAQGFVEHENAGQFGGAHIAEMYERPDWGRGENSGSIKQTISSLPAGYYVLKAKATGGVGKDGDENNGDFLYAKVGSDVVKTKVPNTNDTALDYTVAFVVESTSDVEIGFERINSMWWSAVDDFTLTYYGPVEDVTLKIKANSYGTFVAPFDVTLPENVVAYGISTVSDDWATLSQIDLTNQVLRAGTPVIVKHTEGSEVNETYKGPKATGSVTSNGLIGFYESGLEITDGSYVLQTQGGEQKFYVVDSSKNGALTKSTKNRCCLPASGTGAKVLNLSFGEMEEETAINGVLEEATPVAYFSTNGAQLSAPQKGINLVKMSNGAVKKIFVK